MRPAMAETLKIASCQKIAYDSRSRKRV